jgi:hypothetical protein
MNCNPNPPRQPIFKSSNPQILNKMEFEYSKEHRGKVTAYTFTKDEKAYIASGLTSEIKKLEKKIERINNNPKNEGQATFITERRICRHEIEQLNEIIKAMQI